MGHRRSALALLAATAVVMSAAAVAAATPSSGDTLVTVASPTSPFSQNKQNEPAVAIDPNNPNIVVAGANEEIDMESCAAGAPNTCPFTPGVGVSGVYFSTNGGGTWTQPTYQGWTARGCLGPDACTPKVGAIGTLPHYYENGLVSDGDPALAFGPRRGAAGTFDWANGSRLYYANLTSNFGASGTIKGFEGIAVSRTDDVAAAAAGSGSAWTAPTVISKQSNTTFSDKEQVYADNQANSPFFGRVYVCWASFRSQELGRALPTPLTVARSADGGETWTVSQVGPATNNGIQGQPDGCVVRTDSQGNAYVFGVGLRNGVRLQMMYKSSDGGAHWIGPSIIAPVVPPGVFDPVQGRPVMDGLGGARVDLAMGPNVDIANGRPDGAGSDELFMTFADATNGLNHEQMMLTWSRNGGQSWATPMAVPLATGDRPFYTAPAVSPDGTDLYIVYNAFTTPYRNNTTEARGLVGVVLHANVSGGVPGPFSVLNRGAVGDPRGSSANALTDEFLGDYVYAYATNDSAVAVWNDTRNAADCPAIDAYRASLYTATPLPAPDVLGSCKPNTFGNSDIRGGSYADPS
jgi:hypothetical protein